MLKKSYVYTIRQGPALCLASGGRAGRQPASTDHRRVTGRPRVNPMPKIKKKKNKKKIILI